MRDYARAARRDRAREDAAFAGSDPAAEAERAERLAGIVRIERGPAAYRVTFPKLTAAPKGSPEARAAWDEARRPMAEVKTIMGRRFDSLQAAWIVPLDQAASIEALALDYHAEIEELALAAGLDPDTARRIADLEAQLARVEAERDAAVRLADEYAAMLEGQAA